MLHCLLEPNKTYDLAEAYEDYLHIRFANADSDEELIDFIRAWGPLYLPNMAKPKDGVVSLPLRHCRAYQRQIKALLGALTAFKWGKGEREALEEFIQAVEASDRDDLMTHSLANLFGIQGSVLDWARSANLRDVRAATDFIVRVTVGSSLALKLTCQRKGNRRQVEAGWNFFALEDALRWMVWYDEFTHHPVICCQECRKVFRGETARVRKYCSVECGHRATAREAMRNKRAAERAGGK